MLRAAPPRAAAPSGAPVAAEPAPDRYLRYGGLTALVVGELPGIAWELAGHETAVRAVVAGMVSLHTRREAWDTTGTLSLDGEPFALLPGVNYRVLTTPLGAQDGLPDASHVSAVVLHPDAVLAAMPGAQAPTPTRRRRQRRAQDGTRAGERTGATFAYAADRVDPTTGCPEAFGDMLFQVLRLPFRREWGAALWTAGRAARLVTPLAGQGSLAGVHVHLDPAPWIAPLGPIARQHATTGAARPAAA